MNKILILLAHPLLEKSRGHNMLLRFINNQPGITINDLYHQYPDFDIDVAREQQLLLEHDIVIWQHPLYWYSAPALLKQWLDLVLVHGWAYGKKGRMLEGKKVFNAFTSGGSKDAYRPGGYNNHTVHELLRPFERTAALCRMNYWPPFWVPGTHKMEAKQFEFYAAQYKDLLQALRDKQINEEEIRTANYLNDLIPVH